LKNYFRKSNNAVVSGYCPPIELAGPSGQKK